LGFQVNTKLIKEQDTWRKKAKEIEEREAALLGSKDEMITDLQEQVSFLYLLRFAINS
jgi:BRCA1-associated protein